MSHVVARTASQKRVQAGLPVQPDRQPQDAHGQLQTCGLELVMETTPDGVDYTRVCSTHRWASLPASSPNDVLRCPFCAVDHDAHRGLVRYSEIYTRLVLGY